MLRGRRGPLPVHPAAPVPHPGSRSFVGRSGSPMSADPVTYERRGPAAVVTIDRQERRNAVDGPTAELLAEAYERFEADDEARAMVLTGAGGVSFCAGADLKAIDTFG